MNPNESRKKGLLADFLLAALALILYCVYVKIILPEPFLLNDQLLFREIASGVYTGSPDGHLVYIMHPLGAALAKLYKLIPSVEWYNVLMLSTFPIHCFVLVFAFSSVCKRTLAKFFTAVLVLLTFVGTTVYFTIQNEYTVNAGVIAASALILLIISNYVGDHLGRFYTGLSVVLFTVSCLMRKNIFYTAIPLILFTGVFLFFSKKKLTRYITGVCVLAGVLALCFLAESLAYSSPEWVEYVKYNEARSRIFDYEGLPDYESNKGLYDSLEISREEFTALSKDFGLVKNVDSKKLEALADASERMREGVTKANFKERIWYQFRDEVDLWVRQPIGFFTVILWMITVVLIFADALASRKGARILLAVFPIGTAVYYVAFVLLFIYLGRYPDRVSVPFGYIIFAFSAGILAVTLKESPLWVLKSRKPAGFVLVLISILLILLNVKFIPGKVKRGLANRVFIDAYIELTAKTAEICREDPESIYFVNLRIANWETIDTAKDGFFDTPANFVPLVYWISGSPVHSEHLKLIGIDSPADALTDFDNVYYIAYEDYDLSWLTDLCRFYGKERELTETETLTVPTGTIAVYKIQ
ncbi:MAG: hypothetical protein K6E19_08645 [Lachnospiraceae bacterium]|nr:hypothetical protein [Lachnospiraceae bacterium]